MNNMQFRSSFKALDKDFFNDHFNIDWNVVLKLVKRNGGSSVDRFFKNLWQYATVTNQLKI